MDCQKKQPQTEGDGQGRRVGWRPANRSVVFERTADRWLRLFENNRPDACVEPSAEDLLLIDRAGALITALKTVRGVEGLHPSPPMRADLELLGRVTDGILDRIPLMSDNSALREPRFRVLKGLGWLHHAAVIGVEDVQDLEVKEFALKSIGRLWRIIVSDENLLKMESLSERWSKSVAHPVDVSWRLQRDGVALDQTDTLMFRDAALHAFRFDLTARMSGVGRPSGEKSSALFCEDGSDGWWLGMIRRDDNRLLNEIVLQAVQAAKGRRRPNWDGALNANIIAVGDLTLGDVLPLLRPEQAADLLRLCPGLNGVSGWLETAQRVELGDVSGLSVSGGGRLADRRAL